jgi:uncharacterized protein YyaL (SSP411 family)
MPNLLIDEQSPYLLQHAHNPVEWYPWGDAAFERARRENKPVFLSVGYATCHWCHVMAHESFEDAETAAALNRNFVCIKVDREERPDIDAVYMAACHLVTGSGGWPLTVMMTPDRKPFFAGTYIPKHSTAGRLGLIDLCARVNDLWTRSPDRVIESAREVVSHLGGAFAFEPHAEATPERAVIDAAAAGVAQRYDAQFGGFDGAPKFPSAHRLLFLMQVFKRTGDRKLLDMVAHTLVAMRQGGIWDHVGFGFHRYATDRQWLLPHFEKMLYDQAMLALAYLTAWESTREPFFAQTAREIFTYVLRDMTDPAGGFYTAEDADSEGEEGKSYLWSSSEFKQLAAEDASDIPWPDIFRLESDGNFFDEATRRKTGTNILHMTRSWSQWAKQLNVSQETLERRWEDLRSRLFTRRAGRVQPLRDDKILTDLNGLMIAALAEGAVVLETSEYLDAAGRAADFILEHMTDERGGLRHRFRNGQVAIPATANDYAFFVMGLLGLSRASGNRHWADAAVRLQQQMDAAFWDSEQGGYHLTDAAAEELPVRPKEVYDGAIPSANAVALHNLIGLRHLTSEDAWLSQAGRLIQAFGGSVRKQPSAYLHTLAGWELLSANHPRQPASNRPTT